MSKETYPELSQNIEQHLLTWSRATLDPKLLKDNPKYPKSIINWASNLARYDSEVTILQYQGRDQGQLESRVKKIRNLIATQLPSQPLTKKMLNQETTQTAARLTDFLLNKLIVGVMLEQLTDKEFSQFIQLARSQKLPTCLTSPAETARVNSNMTEAITHTVQRGLQTKYSAPTEQTYCQSGPQAPARYTFVKEITKDNTDLTQALAKVEQAFPE